MKTQYEMLATQLMFSGRLTKTDVESLITIRGLEYRKNKSFTDVKKALEKGVKAGCGKTESEISMVECYLHLVLKKRK